MNLSGIISVAGMSGLYKVVAQSKSGLIVESLVDKKRIPTYANQKVSALEDVSIYSTADDVPLKDVFGKMKEKHNGAAAIDHKAGDDELRKYFESVLPTYDKDRVYVSDIRKVIMWYNILQQNDLLKEEPAAEAEGADKAKLKTAEEKAKTFAKPAKEIKAKTTSAGVKKTMGVRKTGTA